MYCSIGGTICRGGEEGRGALIDANTCQNLLSHCTSNTTRIGVVSTVFIRPAHRPHAKSRHATPDEWLNPYILCTTGGGVAASVW